MHSEDNNTGKRSGHGPGPDDHVPSVDAEHPGYETTDANVHGVALFLAGLFATVIVFFYFCYVMGAAINAQWAKEDGAPTKWTIAAGNVPLGKGKDLASNPEIEQKQLQQIVGNFPTPRLEMDDGEQATADLHAREDLLLEHYSLIDGQPGAIRIPIERAMELVAQRGLPVAGEGQAPDAVAYAAPPQIEAPLTTGFARTGYEQTQIEARQQKMDYGKAESAAESAPQK